LEHMLEVAEGPGLVGAWQSLPRHLAVVASTAKIAASFGCRQAAAFSLVTEYSLADNHKVSDYALAVSTGSIVGDSMLFQGPDTGRTGSPYYRCGGLRLHSISEMQSRYDLFAAEEYDRIHGSAARGGRIEPDGTTVYDEVPPNPYRESAKV
jgi:hypothetical protein